jgi:SAM-dependent methyltransferase
MGESNLNISKIDDLICPFCHNKLILNDNLLECSKCKKEYKIIDGIPSFNQKNEYWCNVEKDKMDYLNKKSRETGDWLSVAKEVIPEYLGHIEPFDRADAQYLWPISANARILDAGSMWGGVTLPVAQHCGEIYAVDKTIETLTFLKIRAEQMGFKNVHTVVSPLQNLPFPDDFFDLVVLNGVLEWVAFDQPVVLVNHWGKKRDDTSPQYSKNPRQMQVDVLSELRRIIKPGGHIFVAIENSIGYQYLAGLPDDHVNLKYVSFLPRFMANIITKKKLNCDYRTYTYSLSGYKSLLKDGGYNDLVFYGAFPHYISPSEIIPIKLIKDWKKQVLPLESPLAPSYAKILARIFPANLLKSLSPSFMIIGKKGESEVPEEPRIIRLIKKIGLIDEDEFNIDVIKVAGRKGNFHSVNMLINIHSSDTKYFCKICRNEKYADILLNEARNLEKANSLLEGTEISSNIPNLLYSGEVEGITIEVMTFIEGYYTDIGSHTSLDSSNLKKLDVDIRNSIEFLVKYQKSTHVKDVDMHTHLSSLLDEYVGILDKNGDLPSEISLKIDDLRNEILSLGAVLIPLCAVHGDFDFYHNILFSDEGVNAIDFEHFELEGLPFLDLATLIFNPILMNDSFNNSDMDLMDFMDKHNISSYVTDWLRLYSKLSGIDIEVVNLFVRLASLEQKTKIYPYFRNPFSFPMYKNKNFLQLLSLKFDSKE